jgi:hypothetical protein
MRERRQFERRPSSIQVKLSHPSFGMIIGSTTDISDGGAHVRLENAVIPPVGTEVFVQFKKVIGHINDEPVAMKVMHCSKNAVGLMFLPRH